ncbi:MAG TPA: RsmD family RNA methyltransferase [Spirochaetota bacterium]|nr:RsmD family RNA methyltransferase [Spirochaetota bacterium]
MRVVTGLLKGRNIPFNNSSFDQADVTSGKVKESVFSIIGPVINGCSFLDLYGGSGQIGFEAYSRGAKVVINERDKKRYQFIKRCADNFGIAQNIKILNFADEVCIRYLFKREYSFDVVYLDPPYVKKRGKVSLYGQTLSSLERRGILNKGCQILIQYHSKNELVSIPEMFVTESVHVYGATSLALYIYSPGL